MDLRKLIQKKRDGAVLRREEIRDFVGAVVTGACPDFQITALLMAIVLRGLDLKETVALTREMARQSHPLPRHPGVPRVGKHSTGGVGDKTTFLLGPLVASYGVEVSFMAGRGLGHTGGTIDKLSGISGLKTALAPAEVLRVLKKTGFCIFEQGPHMAPADRRLYALRDASATVESIPLLVSSILSKKRIEGLDALVLDVKFGSGSFLGGLPRTRLLGKMLLQVAQALGMKTRAVYSSMEQPLGQMVGNNLEIFECLETLRGQGPRDLVELSVKLAREMLAMVLAPKNIPNTRELTLRLTDGSLVEPFLKNLKAQGGKLNSPQTLNRTSRVIKLPALRTGWVRRVDAREVGEACMELGAGRPYPGGPIDPTVGVALLKKVGDSVRRGETIAEIFCQAGSNVRKIRSRINKAFDYSSKPVRRLRLIVGK